MVKCEQKGQSSVLERVDLAQVLYEDLSRNSLAVSL
jgi:hypothetical protein